MIFYVAYTRDHASSRRRPLTFLFNGGPGAASVFLHLGGIGPRRLALNADGTWPPAPVGLSRQPAHLARLHRPRLHRSGRHRLQLRAGPAPEGEKKAPKKGKASDYWGVERDLDSLGEFIRLYLTRHDRWLSPKVIAGESYGGFRVAALARSLPEDFAIAPNGAILISPLMEYAMLGGNRYNLLPWALTLPSLAATAAWHGRGSLAAAAASQDLGAALAPAETFALSGMLTGLAGGAAAAYAEIAAFTGLPEEFVAARRGRIGASAFAKQLLRDQGRLVGRYDGTSAAPIPIPTGPTTKAATRASPSSPRPMRRRWSPICGASSTSVSIPPTTCSTAMSAARGTSRTPSRTAGRALPASARRCASA